MMCSLRRNVGTRQCKPPINSFSTSQEVRQLAIRDRRVYLLLSNGWTVKFDLYLIFHFIVYLRLNPGNVIATQMSAQRKAKPRASDKKIYVALAFQILVNIDGGFGPTFAQECPSTFCLLGVKAFGEIHQSMYRFNFCPPNERNYHGAPFQFLYGYMIDASTEASE